MLNYYRAKLDELLAEAEAAGVVIRVDLVPCLPLAQGNYRMEYDVRHHQKGPPAKRSFPVVPRRPVADKPKRGMK